jgi:hypothetical protein
MVAPSRRPEPCGVRPLGETRRVTVACEGECSCVGWGAMVRQLRPGCFCRGWSTESAPPRRTLRTQGAHDGDARLLTRVALAVRVEARRSAHLLHHLLARQRRQLQTYLAAAARRRGDVALCSDRHTSVGEQSDVALCSDRHTRVGERRFAWRDTGLGFGVCTCWELRTLRTQRGGLLGGEQKANLCHAARVRGPQGGVTAQRPKLPARCGQACRCLCATG